MTAFRDRHPRLMFRSLRLGFIAWLPVCFAVAWSDQASFPGGVPWAHPWHFIGRVMRDFAVVITGGLWVTAWLLVGLIILGLPVIVAGDWFRRRKQSRNGPAPAE